MTKSTANKKTPPKVTLDAYGLEKKNGKYSYKKVRIVDGVVEEVLFESEFASKAIAQERLKIQLARDLVNV